MLICRLIKISCDRSQEPLINKDPIAELQTKTKMMKERFILLACNAHILKKTDIKCFSCKEEAEQKQMFTPWKAKGKKNKQKTTQAQSYIHYFQEQQRNVLLKRAGESKKLSYPSPCHEIMWVIFKAILNSQKHSLSERWVSL